MEKLGPSAEQGVIKEMTRGALLTGAEAHRAAARVEAAVAKPDVQRLIRHLNRGIVLHAKYLGAGAGKVGK